MNGAPHTAPRPSPLVQMLGIQKAYGEGNLAVPVLRGIDFVVQPGEIVALLGPSGCGKSTLLNLVGCLDRPDAGRYELGGRDVAHLTRAEQAWVRLHHIGFVFQFFHLIGHATALENVALPLFYAGVERRKREARARALLRRVGLEGRFDHMPHQLSGGERQRVAIARACVASPQLLLADEPTGALDSRSGDEVLRLLQDLHADTRIAIVLVTHDAHVADLAQRRVHMRDGRIVDGRNPDQVLHAQY